MDKAKKFQFYTELIKFQSKAITSLLHEGLQGYSKVAADLDTMFVDDDDNIHVVLHEHKNSVAIAAAQEVLKELKEAQKKIYEI